MNNNNTNNNNNNINVNFNFSAIFEAKMYSFLKYGVHIDNLILPSGQNYNTKGEIIPDKPGANDDVNIYISVPKTSTLTLNSVHMEGDTLASKFKKEVGFVMKQTLKNKLIDEFKNNIDEIGSECIPDYDSNNEIFKEFINYLIKDEEELDAMLPKLVVKYKIRSEDWNEQKSIEAMNNIRTLDTIAKELEKDPEFAEKFLDICEKIQKIKDKDKDNKNNKDKKYTESNEVKENDYNE